MIRIAVIEDERPEQEHMEVLLREYQKEKEVRFDVSFFDDGADFIEAFHNQFDIIFCDIKMKFTDGITTAKEIRSRNSKAIIIFTTNLIDFAIQGYEVEALGYILKPVSGVLLERCLDRALQHIETEETTYLTVEGATSIINIPTDDILYIECAKHYQYIYTQRETYKVLIPLFKLEEKLDPRAFMRCSNGCLVHLKHVQKLEKNIVTVGGDCLPVSRGKMKDFMTGLTSYLTTNM